ncbi:MAG: hypothetical protein JNL08_09950 [Planctomycetes bacterium]|nr:hypothetical protein [Planctomycetota bacterium]
MRPSPLDGLRLAGVLLFLGSLCYAHGGRYPGPGDVVPPSSGPGSPGGTPTGPTGPETGAPSAPSAPAPTAPGTGGGGGSTGGGTPPGTPPGSAGRTGGFALEPDLTEWTFWWEFNKDEFLRLKDAVHLDTPETGSLEQYLGYGRRRDSHDSLKPTREQIHATILPALHRALAGSDNRDIATGCMVAMAKVGADHRDFALVDVFAPRLRRPDQEVRETAALALGIAGIAGERELDLLEGLARDGAQGREACGGAVDYRTRAFAAYGLGLQAHAHTQTAVKARAFAALRDLLATPNLGRDLRVAAIQGISLLNVDGSIEADRALRDEALQALDAYYSRPLGPGEQLIQAHCPIAIARLLGRGASGGGAWRDRFAADLAATDKPARRSHDIARSCAIALGTLATADDTDISTLLLDTWHDHKDVQTRCFALMAMARIGGARHRAALLHEFDRGRNHEQAWCALALGVLAFGERERDPAARRDRTITATLADALQSRKDPSLLGALAIGLGLAGGDEAADHMRSMMLGNVAKEDMAGYLCVGLALMDHRAAIEDIRAVALKETRRDRLLVQAAVALGRLGDKAIANDLLQLLPQQGENNLAKLAAIAQALGYIGDRRSIDALQALLFDADLHPLARGFAAVALGGVADKEPVPWNAKLRRDSNYRAAVETLTNQATGILDIL